MKELKLDLQWGGYYASMEGEEKMYGVFRILDFNQDAYHVALFTEKFKDIPTIEELKKLKPFIGHAPIDSRALLNKVELHLIGSKELKKEDLDGYGYYLEAHEADEKYVMELFNRIIDFSKNKPMKLTLKLDNEELVIEERK